MPIKTASAALALCFSALLQCSAAPLRRVLSDPSCNRVQYPAGDSPDFRCFLSAWDSLRYWGNADVRILHVGGSHVQAGSWSDRLRSRMVSQRYGSDGGRGLVFPFAAAQTNTPVSYTSTASGEWESSRCLHPDVPLGLSGMAAIARDTSCRVAIDLLPREAFLHQPRYVFDSVEVLGGGSMEPVLLLQGRDTLRGTPSAYGYHFSLPYYTDWLQLCFCGKGRYTLRGFYLDKPASGITLVESGVNGATTQAWLRCELWEKELQLLRPDLVIFSIGINDIQGNNFDPERFKANYRELVRRVKRVNPHCAFLFTGVNDSWLRHGPNPYGPQVQKACEQLAKEFRGAFWDFYSVMGGEGSMAVWQEAGFAQPDKVHFTPAGYRLLGDLLFDALQSAPRK